jgi:hypothetical protein
MQMKNLKLTILATVLASMTGAAFADAPAINDDMSRRPANSISGDGVSTVEANCATDPSGDDWQGATAHISVEQDNAGSHVQLQIDGGVPNTHYTLWMRIKGGAGFNDAGSPWTGGGATPMCSGTEFTELNANSPWNNAAGSQAKLCNSLVTNNNGDGRLKTVVNFPIVGGAYPFQQAGGAVAHPTKGGGADVPTAIVNPATGTGGPFLFRVVSHCTDGANHGLSPATREAFFQYP